MDNSLSIFYILKILLPLIIIIGIPAVAAIALVAASKKDKNKNNNVGKNTSSTINDPVVTAETINENASINTETEEEKILKKEKIFKEVKIIKILLLIDGIIFTILSGIVLLMDKNLRILMLFLLSEPLVGSGIVLLFLIVLLIVKSNQCKKM